MEKFCAALGSIGELDLRLEGLSCGRRGVPAKMFELNLAYITYQPDKGRELEYEVERFAVARSLEQCHRSHLHNAWTVVSGPLPSLCLGYGRSVEVFADELQSQVIFRR